MVKTPQFQCGSYQALALVNELENRPKLLPGVEATNSLAALSKAASFGLDEGNMRWIVTRAPRELFNQNCDLLTVYVYLKAFRRRSMPGSKRRAALGHFLLRPSKKAARQEAQPPAAAPQLAKADIRHDRHCAV